MDRLGGGGTQLRIRAGQRHDSGVGGETGRGRQPVGLETRGDEDEVEGPGVDLGGCRLPFRVPAVDALFGLLEPVLVAEPGAQLIAEATAQTALLRRFRGGFGILTAVGPRTVVGLAVGTDDDLGGVPRFAALPRAVVLGGDRSGAEADLAAQRVDAGDLGGEAEAAPGVADLGGERLGEGGVVGDRGVRGVEGLDASHARFDLLHSGPVDEADTGYPVLLGPGGKLLEAVDLVGVLGDDELPAFAVGQTRLGEIRDEEFDATAGECGLETARFFVQSGVDDACGVPGLGVADGSAAFEDRDLCVGELTGDLAGESHTDDACADDCHS